MVPPSQVRQAERRPPWPRGAGMPGRWARFSVRAGWVQICCVSTEALTHLASWWRSASWSLASSCPSASACTRHAVDVCLAGPHLGRKRLRCGDAV